MSKGYRLLYRVLQEIEILEVTSFFAELQNHDYNDAQFAWEEKWFWVGKINMLENNDYFAETCLYVQLRSAILESRNKVAQVNT